MPITREVTQIMKKLGEGRGTVIDPKNLKRVLGVHNKDFQNSDQQDAHELFGFLIHQMDDELKKYIVS